MANLPEIRRELLALAKQLTEALASDSRCRSTAALVLRTGRAQYTDTEGYAIEIGRLGRRIFVELWLDHFAGLPSPRAWFGFSSRVPRELLRLLARPDLSPLRERLIHRAGRDVTAKSPQRFIHPLRSGEFDILVRENYVGDRDYLGVYSAYPWPFSRGVQRAMIREAVNLIAAFCAAYAMAPGTSSQASGTPGPWARPDPRTEQAAVRHVRRYLCKAGYRVKTREQEICGYDLHATRDSDELHVEVKGCLEVQPRFFITRTEERAARDDQHWRLAIIADCRRNPATPKLLTGVEMRRLFTLEPTQWEGRRTRVHGSRLGQGRRRSGGS